jgi:hypothetical protein
MGSRTQDRENCRAGPERPAFSRYSRVCWDRFTAPEHAGPPPAETPVLASGEARGRSGDCEVRIWLGQEPRVGWFLVHGSPWAIAAADLAVSDWRQGRNEVAAADLAARLDAPAEVLDAFLTVEDAWRSARESIEN